MTAPKSNGAILLVVAFVGLGVSALNAWGGRRISNPRVPWATTMWVWLGGVIFVGFTVLGIVILIIGR